jgi:hypothetical protein
MTFWCVNWRFQAIYTVHSSVMDVHWDYVSNILLAVTFVFLSLIYLDHCRVRQKCSNLFYLWQPSLSRVLIGNEVCIQVLWWTYIFCSISLPGVSWLILLHNWEYYLFSDANVLARNDSIFTQDVTILSVMDVHYCDVRTLSDLFC